MMLPVAILAGGLATRLRPLTEKIPKALIDIAGRPFIIRQLELLKRHGIGRAVLCVGFLGEMIVDVVGDGRRLGMSVEYSFDGPALLGTGGSLNKALPLLGEAFFVLYGDSYLDCDYNRIQEAFQTSGKPALMTVLRNEGKWDASNVVYEQGRIIAYDKKNRTPDMRHIDYGLSVLKPEIFSGRKAGEAFDLADLYHGLVQRGAMAGFEVLQRFYEIGSPRGIEELITLFDTRAAGNT